MPLPERIIARSSNKIPIPEEPERVQVRYAMPAVEISTNFRLIAPSFASQTKYPFSVLLS